MHVNKYPYKVERVCPTHGKTVYILRNKKKGWYNCRTCAYDWVRKCRRKRKAELVNEFGGKCIRCGYSKSFRALEFHHRDPSTKLFNLSGNKFGGSLESLRKEAAKCDLLCANCHREVEDESI